MSSSDPDAGAASRPGALRPRNWTSALIVWGQDQPRSAGTATHLRPRLRALVEVIIGPDAPPRSRIRTAAASLRQIVLELATDLAGGG